MKSAMLAVILLAAPHAEAAKIWAHCDGELNPGLVQEDDGSFRMFAGEDGASTPCALTGSTLKCDYVEAMQIEFVSDDVVKLDGVPYRKSDKACDE